MKSIKRRLLLSTGVATIAIFLIAGVTLYSLARHFLTAEFDDALRSKANTIASMTEFDGRELRIDADDVGKLPEFTAGAEPEYFQITTSDGRQVASSQTLGEAPLAKSAGPIVLPDARAGRSLTINARAQADSEEPAAGTLGPEIAVTVAKSTAQLDRMLVRLRLLSLAVFGAGTVGLLAICGLLIRRELSPLHRLAREIESIRADDLAARISTAQTPAELSPVVARLNDLLARLETAFERERCFTADAAHELRTPLAGMKTALEVCARKRRNPQEYAQVVDDCLAVVGQMHGIVDNLLLLARTESGAVSVDKTELQLAALVRDAWSGYQEIADARRLSVRFDLDDELAVTTDPDKFAIILNNLFDNAVHHADEGGDVSIVAARSGSAARLQISNTGNRVRPDDAHHVFERFWRGDVSRTNRRNCGLGLSVCQRLATLLRGTIAVECEADGKFVVTLELPDAASSSDQMRSKYRVRSQSVTAASNANAS